MPTYRYRCGGCGEEFEVWQSFTEDPLHTHDHGCGGELVKVLTPAGIVLKGRASTATTAAPGPASGAAAPATAGRARRVERRRVERRRVERRRRRREAGRQEGRRRRVDVVGWGHDVEWLVVVEQHHVVSEAAPAASSGARARRGGDLRLRRGDLGALPRRPRDLRGRARLPARQRHGADVRRGGRGHDGPRLPPPRDGPPVAHRLPRRAVSDAPRTCSAARSTTARTSSSWPRPLSRCTGRSCTGSGGCATTASPWRCSRTTCASSGTRGAPPSRSTSCSRSSSISSEVGMRKPDPAIYEHTCARLGIAPDVAVFVDDVEENVDRGRGGRARHGALRHRPGGVARRAGRHPHPPRRQDPLTCISSISMGRLPA